MADPNKTIEEATADDKEAAKKLTEQWVINKLMAIAEADFTKVVEQDAYGFPSVNLDLLDDNLKVAIQEIQHSNAKGNKRITIKPADKLKALDMLGKYLAMFKDNVKVEGELTLVERLQEGRARMNAENEVLKHGGGELRLVQGDEIRKQVH